VGLGRVRGADDLDVEEYSEGQVFPPGATLDNLWFVPKSEEVGVAGSEFTKTTFDHRAFGPNGLDLYYFTQIPSTVIGLNQNCMYPGRGPAPLGKGNPGDRETCSYVENNGNVTQTNCITDISIIGGDNDTGCGYGDADTDVAVSSTSACLEQMRGGSVFTNPFFSVE
jgi:hypothetical protein